MAEIVEMMPAVVRSRRKPRRWLIDECGCWVWQNAIQSNGYGVTSNDDGSRVLAHRWSYEYHVGPIAEGMVIDHLCRVKACVNPSHLEVVTQATNIRRGDHARWTPADIRYIRESPLSANALARELRCDASDISKIRRRIHWQDVA